MIGMKSFILSGSTRMEYNLTFVNSTNYSQVYRILRGGGNMIVEVPKEIETALGDKIVFPENSNKVIGVIRDIISDDRDADKKLYITLPTNVLTLDHVFIQQ